MHVQQQKRLAHNKSHGQDRLLTVFFVILASFSFGLIPIIADLTATNSQQEVILPTEAELWR